MALEIRRVLSYQEMEMETAQQAGGSPWLPWQQALGLANKLSQPTWLATFHTGGGNVAGSQSGYGCTPTGLDDEHLGCQERSREVGTGLPPTLTFSSLLFQPFKVYQGEGAASQNILVARRASEWQKVLRTLEKRYIRLKANGRFGSYYVDIFITKRQLMRRWNRRLRKYARKREEVGKEKISREHRTKQDQRETKTSLHTGTTWGKQKENAVQGMGKEHESYLTHKENF